MTLTPRLTKADTNFRKALEPGLKLAMTLHFMATGNSFHALAYAFQVPHNTISMFLSEVFQAIIAEYGDEVVKMPSNEEETYCHQQFHH